MDVTYDCNYDLINGVTGDVIQSRRKTSCFRDLQGSYLNDSDYVKVYIKKDDVNYTEQQIIDYIEFINDFYLTCRYAGEEVVEAVPEWGGNSDFTMYVIVVEAAHHNTNTMLATLSAVRYLYEGYFDEIPKTCFELKAKYPKWGRLRCMYAAHLLCWDKVRWGVGHALVDTFSNFPLKKAKLRERMLSAEYNNPLIGDDSRAFTKVNSMFRNKIDLPVFPNWEQFRQSFIDGGFKLIRKKSQEEKEIRDKKRNDFMKSLAASVKAKEADTIPF